MEALSRRAIKSRMAEVEAREVLRRWLSTSDPERDVQVTAGLDSATVRRYLQAGEAAGLDPKGGEEQLKDDLIKAVVEATRPARISTIQLLGGAVIIILLIGAITSFFLVRICDERITQRGKVVQVCRHFQGTDPPAIAVGILAIAILGVFFSEISGFGISLKGRVQAAQENAQQARELAGEARGNTLTLGRAAEQATTDAGDAKELATLAISSGASNIREAVEKAADEARRASADATLSPAADLANQYNEVRLTMPSGNERTARMTAIVNNMISSLSGLDDFNVAAHLASSDRGLRLAAYAYLCANPDPSMVPQLVDNAVKEDKPFGQIWAIRSLLAQAEANPQSFDTNSVWRLRALDKDLPPGTDRARELKRLLNLVGRQIDLR
jgi:hypothetical protein